MSNGELNQIVNESKLRKSVVIPTYRRPEMLVRCVESLVAGSCLPDEIVIVGRKGDVGTEDAIGAINAEHASAVRIRSAWVTEPGYIPPVEAGVRIASGDLVAVLDDDVTVTPDWLAFNRVAFFGSRSWPRWWARACPRPSAI